MISRRWTGWMGAALGMVIAVGADVSWAGDDAPPRATDESQPALAERFRDAKVEWEVLEQPFYLTLLKATTKAEKENALAAKPDVIVLALRMVNLAESSPDDPAVAGAMLWLLNRSGWPPAGPMAEIERRAIEVLVEHHADDPAVDRAGINLAGKFSPKCEELLSRVVENASKPEARGLASLALAFYLIKKADAFERFQAADTGEPGPNATAKAFRENWRACDVAATRREAESLLTEVVNRYQDIPFVREGGVIVARRKTLGEAAESLLDEMHHLAIGKPAPNIDGVDLDGNRLNLADYRGKVVAIVFWASWCGPCVAEIPNERALLARHADEPFALLGVNADENRAVAQKSADDYGVNWPNWNDPRTTAGEGPINDLFHVRAIPMVVVLDGAGIIRAKGVSGERLERVVQELLAELKEAAVKP